MCLYFSNYSKTLTSEIRQDSHAMQSDAKVQEFRTDQDLRSKIEELTDDVNSNTHNINIISVCLIFLYFW